MAWCSGLKYLNAFWTASFFSNLINMHIRLVAYFTEGLKSFSPVRIAGMPSWMADLNIAISIIYELWFTF